MLQKMYAIYDQAVGAYLNPFFMRSRGEAVRSFGQAVSDPKSAFHSHPADYTLFEIGQYDDVTGIVEPWDAKVNLGTALEHWVEPESGMPLFEGNSHGAPPIGDESSLQRSPPSGDSA